jgi:hypothetical protein
MVRVRDWIILSQIRGQRLIAMSRLSFHARKVAGIDAVVCQLCGNSPGP